MREKINLVSSAGTDHFYTTTKNKKNTPDKLEFKKYDPVVRKHVIYREVKIKYALPNFKKPAQAGFLPSGGRNRLCHSAPPGACRARRGLEPWSGLGCARPRS